MLDVIKRFIDIYTGPCRVFIDVKWLLIYVNRLILTRPCIYYVIVHNRIVELQVPTLLFVYRTTTALFGHALGNRRRGRGEEGGERREVQRYVYNRCTSRMC